MSTLPHSRMKMTSAGGNLHVCSINQVLSRSFHKHLCLTPVALLSQCVLLQRSAKGSWNISEMQCVRRLSAISGTKMIQVQGKSGRMSQMLKYQRKDRVTQKYFFLYKAFCVTPSSMAPFPLK